MTNGMRIIVPFYIEFPPEEDSLSITDFIDILEASNLPFRMGREIIGKRLSEIGEEFPDGRSR